MAIVLSPARVFIRFAESRAVTFTAKVWKGKDGYYVAQCEELPGCITQGKTLKEVTRNFGEALELYLEEALQKGEAARLEPDAPIQRIRFELAPA